MAFLSFYLFFFKDFYETVSIQLVLKEGKPRPDTCKDTNKQTNPKSGAGRDWSPVGRLASKVLAVSLPPAADAGHVCVELAGQAAAGAALQEGGPDGRLEQLPPVLVQFWRGGERRRRWWLIPTEPTTGQKNRVGRFGSGCLKQQKLCVAPQPAAWLGSGSSQTVTRPSAQTVTCSRQTACSSGSTASPPLSVSLSAERAN